MKKAKMVLTPLLVASAWLMALFAQHVTCYDVFDTNFWYLYLMAAGFGALHIALVNTLDWKFLFPCFVVYSVVAVLKAIQFGKLLFSGTNLWGLSAVCLILDIGGTVYAWHQIHKMNQN